MNRARATSSRQRQKEELKLAKEEVVKLDNDFQLLLIGYHELHDLYEAEKSNEMTKQHIAERFAEKPEIPFVRDNRTAIQDSFSVHTEQSSSLNYDHSYFLYLSQILSYHQLELDDVDFQLLNRMEEGIILHDFLCYTDICAHFVTLGIGIEIGGNTLPENVSFPSFRYGEEKRTVILNTEMKSALGLSLLLWVLPPHPEHVQFVENIIKNASNYLNNCVIEAVGGSKAESSKPSNLVVPLGWLYMLNITDSEIDKHGEIGHLAVSIGSSKQSAHPLQPKSTPFKPSRKKKPNDRNSSEHLKELLQIFKSKDSGEVLLIDENARLWYYPIFSKSTEITSISSELQALGLGAGLGASWQKSAEYEAALQFVLKGFPVPFRSFNAFIRKPMMSKEESHIIGWIQWFERVLDYQGVYPKGYNDGLLRSVISCWNEYDRCDMFHKEDMRITKPVLQKYNVKQKRNGDGLQVKIPASSKVYIARCGKKDGAESHQSTDIGDDDNTNVDDMVDDDSQLQTNLRTNLLH